MLLRKIRKIMLNNYVINKINLQSSKKNTLMRSIPIILPHTKRGVTYLLRLRYKYKNIFFSFNLHSGSILFPY